MTRSTLGAAVLLVASFALVAGCGSDDGDDDTPSTSGTELSATVPTTPTTAPTTATTAGSTTSSSPVNTLPVLVPGQPCTAGSDPDCIDPEGNGQYVYLIGGAECMASPIGGPMCTDLDGDGRAGYPDSG